MKEDQTIHGKRKFAKGAMDLETMNGNMEKVLREEGYLMSAAFGISMLPCIRPNRDVLLLERADGRCKNRDVILYKRKNGTYILHRILEVRKEDYVLCGDNQYQKEYGVRQEQILGVLKGFYRGEKYIDCEKNRGYRLYVQVWCASLKLRKWMIRFENMERRVLRKLKWKKN